MTGTCVSIPGAGTLQRKWKPGQSDPTAGYLERRKVEVGWYSDLLGRWSHQWAGAPGIPLPAGGSNTVFRSSVRVRRHSNSWASFSTSSSDLSRERKLKRGAWNGWVTRHRNRKIHHLEDLSVILWDTLDTFRWVLNAKQLAADLCFI